MDLESTLAHQQGALEKENHRLRQENHLKSEFLANMSHELRTPLNAIIGFAEVMHDGKAGPISTLQMEFLSDIITSSTHLLQLINGVLDISKVESGKMDFHPEAVSIDKFISEVTDSVRLLAAKKGIEMKTELDPTIPEVVIDRARLKQVLYNYLSNAMKFTQDTPVTIRVRPEGHTRFCLEVEDTGIGIRPEDISRLFVEFQQLEAGAAKKYEGTGLGLALTKRIVEAQGGCVGARSTLGQGSLFFAILPRVAGMSDSTGTTSIHTTP